MRTQTLLYQAGTTRCAGLLATPDDGAEHPAVLVAHEGPGLDRHARERTQMLASLGYIAFAADLHGNGHVASSHDETMRLVGDLRRSRKLLRERIRAAFDVLREQDGVLPERLAAIGYCFGGMAVLELARSGASVAATVVFHGLLDTPDPQDAVNIKGSVLVCTGAADDLVPEDQIRAFEREMTAANVDWQVNRYGGARHAFTNYVDAAELEKLGFGYHAAADRRSWSAMRCFLDDVFDRPKRGAPVHPGAR